VQGKASRTALSVAKRRATHQLVDRPLVFEDPLAVRIVGVTGLLESTSSRRSAGFRAWMAVRSRYAEDRLAAAYARGVRQFVILGAGLDTFGYRNPWPDLRVFEVDHPATQAWKMELLESAGIAIPASVSHVAIDFDIQELTIPGLSVGEPVFFSWLGVTPYLTREGFDSTIRFIAAQGAGSEVVFDYAILPSLMNAHQLAVMEGLSQKVEQIGEPFRLFFDPGALAVDLRAAGFAEIEDLDGSAADARYFAGRADGLRVSGASAHLLSAVTGTSL
jgi:methyltransferase (TIGR00027 family)